MPQTPYRAPQPPIGLPVQWFAHADPDEPPQSALVTQISNNSTVKLAILPASGPALGRTGIRHIADPYFKTAEKQVKVSRGAWGFIPGLEVKDALPLQEMQRQIRNAHTEGKSPAEIAKLLGPPWNHDKIVGYLRRQGLINA